MTTTLTVIFVITLALGIILPGWYHYLRWRYRKVIAEKYQIIAPLIEKLARKETVSPTEVELMIRDAPTLRYAAYRTLEAYGHLDLFPARFLTLESSAESFLITWLEFPTELGEAPHEIEPFTTIDLDGSISLTYYVFRYRMQNDHWAARYGWMFGVVGPYTPRSKPYDTPTKIFSRFNATDTTTAEAEARWVHENIS
jgi:hypothetical protein